MAAPMESSKSGRQEREIGDKQDDAYLETVDRHNRNKRKAVLLSAVGFSLFMGFGFTMYRIKRKDPVYFQKILKPSVDIPETGVSVASKALAYATVISVTSLGLLTWLTFKVMGVRNANEFHAKLQTYFPPKGPEGRSDFKDLKELVIYLESEDRKAELLKKKKANS